MLAAVISSAVVLFVAILGTTWRLGLGIGTLITQVADLTRRVGNLEKSRRGDGRVEAREIDRRREARGRR